MARRQHLIEAAPDRVWDVLAEPHSYARWVVGTQDILSADPSWPAPGAELAFRAGIGPLVVEDVCTVRICEPGRRLELEARADPLRTARIAFHLVPWDRHTLVILDEHPLRGLGARLHNPAVELLLHLRNRKLLRNLARTATRPAPCRTPAT